MPFAAGIVVGILIGMVFVAAIVMIPDEFDWFEGIDNEKNQNRDV